MTNHQFNIWLATHQFTKKQVAIELGLTPQTLTNYKNNEFYPKVFELALKALEK